MATVTAGTENQPASLYRDEVAQLPYVRKVILAEATIWTVIDVPPLDFASRFAVYDVELKTRLEFPGLPLGFRLINVADFEPADLPSILPSNGVVLYERSEAT